MENCKAVTSFKKWPATFEEPKYPEKGRVVHIQTLSIKALTDHVMVM